MAGPGARVAAAVGNAYLLAFAADGVVSSLHAAGGWDALAPARAILAWSVMLASPFVYVLAGCTRLLPRRVFLPLPLFALLLLPIGGLLYASLGPALADVLVSLAQAATAAAAFVLLRARDARWLAVPGGDGLRLRYAVGFAAFNAFVVVPGAVGTATAAALGALHAVTGGYVRIGADGVHCLERTFAKDGREVRLVGMIHLGDAAFYRALAASFDVDGAVVLEEGVVDTRAAEGEIVQAVLAREVGLDTQAELVAAMAETERVVRRRADLTFADLDPRTVAFFDALEKAIRSGDWSAVARQDLAALRPVIVRDVYDRRNAHLVEEIDRALGAYGVVIVPWGAAHMPAMEAALAERGFVRAGETRRRAFGWRSLGRSDAEERALPRP